MVALGKIRRRTPARTRAQSRQGGVALLRGVTYADGPSGGVALYNRPSGITCPNGPNPRKVFYNYPSSGSIGDTLTRLENMLGRPLLPQKPGRKPKQPKETARKDGNATVPVFPWKEKR